MPRAATAKAKAKPETAAQDETPAAVETPIAATAGDVAAVEIALHLIDENPQNPRSPPATKDDEDADAELTASIGMKGVLQPIMVRPSAAEPGRFVAIMGSRRLRCSKAAGRFTIPAVVRDVGEAEAFEIASIENLQRQDMNPLDEAKAFRRILDDRLAADPALKLKDAKQVIADATGKSLRFVELRLQLLTMPATLQVEVREGKTSPKDAILRQRQMPKLKPWSSREWLTLLEVFDKAKREPRCAPRYEWEAPNTFCRPDTAALIEADPDIANLAASYDLDRPEDIHEETPIADGRGVRYGPKTGFVEIGIHSSTVYQLRLLAKDRLALEDEPDLDDTKIRARLLAALRSDVEISGRLPAGASRPAKLKVGEYVTPWLNGPFDPSPERLAEIAAEQQAQAEREAGWQRQRDEQAAVRQVAAARQARHRGDEGRALLAQVMTLQADVEAGGLAGDGFRARFAEILQASDGPAPFAVIPGPPDDPRAVTIVDAAGDDHGGYGYVIEAKRRLIVMALNHCAGLPALSGPAIPEPEPQSEDAVRLDSGEDLDADDDEFGDQFDDDDGGPVDDDEPALEDAQASDDETPDFLLRLAGGQPQAEAGA